MVLEQYSEDKFKKEQPGLGQAMLLYSGTLCDNYGTPLATCNDGTWSYDTGSWVENSPMTVYFDTGSKIIGIKLNNRSNNYSDLSNTRNFFECTRIRIKYDIKKAGEGYVTIDDDCTILSRDIKSSMTYFEIEGNIPTGSDNTFQIQFNTSGSGLSKKFLGYSTISSSLLSVSLIPYNSDIENTVFDPVADNVIEDVKSTHVYVVEENNLTGINYATIPDYFYTAKANTSGRYLGTKQTYLLNGQQNYESEQYMVSKSLEIAKSSCVKFDSSSIETYSGSVASWQESPILPVYTVKAAIFNFEGASLPSSSAIAKQSLIISQSSAILEGDTATYDIQEIKFTPSLAYKNVQKLIPGSDPINRQKLYINNNHPYDTYHLETYDTVYSPDMEYRLSNVILYLKDDNVAAYVDEHGQVIYKMNKPTIEPIISGNLDLSELEPTI